MKRPLAIPFEINPNDRIHQRLHAPYTIRLSKGTCDPILSLDTDMKTALQCRYMP